MASKSFETDNLLVKYTSEHSLRLLPVQEKLKTVTLQHSWSIMMGAPEVAQLLQNLIRTINAKKIIEVGVYTGFSTLAFALASPPDAKIIACDVSEEYMNIGIPFWKEAGVEHKIIKKIKPAAETLDELLANGEEGTYDLAFIDADKKNYETYYEKCLQLIRKGGIIAVDNVLWGGSVVEENSTMDSVKEIKQFNDKLKDDKRINISMLLIGDGLTLAFKI